MLLKCHDCMLSVPYRPDISHISSELRQEAGRATMHCRVSHGTGPSLTVREGSGVAMRPTASDPASLRGRAPEPPCALGSGPRRPTWEGSKAATCPTTHGRRIKKYSATMVRLEGSCVTEERSHGPRHLQDARASGDIMTCKACRSRRYSTLL
jgi:hypothetical protein